MTTVKANILIPILGLFLAFQASAETSSSLRLETKIEGKATYSEKASKEKTQARKLAIEVSNTAEQPVAGTTVRWAIYGHTMKGNKLVVIKEGKQQITVPARGSLSVSSPEVKVTGNREQTVPETVKAKGNSKKKNKVTFKKIPAAGDEYYGYGVEVLSNGKVVAFEYSKPSIGEAMGSGR